MARIKNRRLSIQSIGESCRRLYRRVIRKRKNSAIWPDSREGRISEDTAIKAKSDETMEGFMVEDAVQLEDVKGSDVGSEALGHSGTKEGDEALEWRSDETPETRLLEHVEGSEYASESESSVQSRRSVEGELAPAATSVEQDFLDLAEIERRSRFLLTQIPDGYEVVGWFPGRQIVCRPINGAVPEELPLERTADFQYEALKPGYIRLLTIHPTELGSNHSKTKAPYADVGDGDELEVHEDEAELLCSLSTVRIVTFEDSDLHPRREGEEQKGKGKRKENEQNEENKKQKLEQHLPSFQAISHRWGSEDTMTRLRAYNSIRTPVPGGWTHRYETYSNSSFQVTANVEKILRRLSHKSEARMIWIDQICINQKDNAEKGEQVKLMAHIYAKAAKVQIWLGEEDEQTGKAFRCIERLAAMEAFHWVNPTKVRHSTFRNMRPWDLQSTEPEYIIRGEWEALRELFIERTWFRRAWILQEIVMARYAIVLCGHFALSWTTLVQACQVIQSLDIYLGPWHNPYRVPNFAISNVVDIAALQYTLQENYDPLGLRLMERLLVDTRHLMASDPRDIIYSKLSLCRNSRPLPEPDYTAPVRDAYIRIALYWLFNWRANLDILNYVQAGNTKHDLPSWVPDWSVPSIAPVVAAVRMNGGFDATGHDRGLHPSMVTLPEIPEVGAIDRGLRLILTVRGVSLMTIAIVQNEAVYSHEILVPSLPSYPTTGESYGSVCSRLLKSQNIAEYLQCPPQTLPFWDYARNKEQLRNSCDGSTQQRRDNQRTLVDPTLTALESLRVGRALFTSACGFMGLGPAFTDVEGSGAELTYRFSGGMLVGDVVCFLFGARTPFVVRRVETDDDEGKRWRLVGECFVYGLMHGEAIAGLDEGLKEDFRIE